VGTGVGVSVGRGVEVGWGVSLGGGTGGSVGAAPRFPQEVKRIETSNRTNGKRFIEILLS
jgi:hypothetical protein